MPDRRPDEHDACPVAADGSASAPAQRPQLHAHEKAGLDAWIRSDTWERVRQ